MYYCFNVGPFSCICLLVNNKMNICLFLYWKPALYEASGTDNLDVARLSPLNAPLYVCSIASGPTGCVRCWAGRWAVT